MSKTPVLNNVSFLKGGGETGAIVRNINWSNTPLGDPSGWTDSIKWAVTFCLNSGFSNALYLGPEFILIYNDAYIPIAGDKHPWAMGKSRKEVWPETWSAQLQQQFETVMSGESLNGQNHLFPVNRYGFLEECYFDYTFSPIYDIHGTVIGFLNTVTETTYRVVNARRNKLLYQLSLQFHSFKSKAQAFSEAISPLKEARIGIPFCMLFMPDAATQTFILTQSTGIDPQQTEQLKIALTEIFTSGTTGLIELAATGATDIYPQQWSQPSSQAFVLPLKQDEQHMIGLMVAGIHPGIKLDDSYLHFLETTALHISTAIINGSNYDDDIQTQFLIREKQDELEFIIDATELGIWDLDPKANRFKSNQRLKDWFGLTAGEDIDLTKAINAIAAKDRERVKAAMKKAMTYGLDYNYDITYTIINSTAGTLRHVWAKGKALFNDQREIIRFSGTLQDITNATVALEALEESNKRLQIALNAGKLGLYELDLKTGKRWVSEQLNLNFGLPKDAEYDFKDLLQVIHPDYRELVLEHMDLAIKNHYLFEVQYMVQWPSDSSLHWISSVGMPEYDDNGKPEKITGVAYDITEHVFAQENMERTYEQLRLSKEAAQLGMFDMNLEEGTMEWDSRCRELFGISHQDQVSYDSDFANGLHPEDRERVLTLITDLFNKEISNGDYDVEYRTIGKEDNRLRWVRAKGKVFFNDKDEPVRFIGSVLDITDKKQVELRKNDFIGIVSHELKTPLTSLKAYVQVLKNRSVKKNEPFEAEALGKVELQVNKMSNMINSFLNVARLESGKILLHRTDFILNGLISEIIAETALIIPSHTIEVESCHPILVRADRDKIGHVLSNLLSNAAKYSPKGKVITIGCRVKDNMVIVSVKDEGIGISQQDQEKLFDRFYRIDNPNTKHISGFGIGLYLSKEIIELHHGKIWVESKKGEGSTFLFSVSLA